MKGYNKYLRLIVHEWVGSNPLSCSWGGVDNSNFIVLSPFHELLSRVFNTPNGGKRGYRDNLLLSNHITESNPSCIYNKEY